MNTSSSLLDNSLMDRFIAIHLKDSDCDLVKYIIHGLKSSDHLLKSRTEWFGKGLASNLSWHVEGSEESIFEEVRQAAYLMFAILGNREKKSSKYSGKFEEVSTMFLNMVRLSVAQNQDITTASKYRTYVCSADVSLQYLLYRLGFAEFVRNPDHEVLRLKGEKASTQNSDGQASKQENQKNKPKDVMFGDISKFISQRIERLEGNGVTGAENISGIVKKLNHQRNRLSHSAFYTNPNLYWDNLTYILYDYIAIIFFLRRYMLQVLNSTTNPADDEDMTAVENAVAKSEYFINEALDMTVRFQFVHESDIKRKLAVREKGAVQSTKRSQPIPNPETETLADGRTVWYYELPVKRFSEYEIQSFFVKNGVDIEDGKILDLNSGLLFDGAVVELKMPTSEIPYPSIESIIALSTGLIEDTENRSFIEKLLENNIKDDEFRSKLRILLLLDEGEKTSLLDEFVSRKSAGNCNFDADAFKKFIEEQNALQLATIEKRLEALNDSIQSNHSELKELIPDVLARIDLRGLISTQSEYHEEFLQFVEQVSAWQKENERRFKENEEQRAREYEQMTAALASSKKSIKELSDYVKTETEKAEEVRKKAKRKKLINRSLAAAAILFVILVSWYCIDLRVSDGEFVHSNEWNTRFADLLGNRNAAYARALYLEKNGEYPDAARWYMKARKNYADHLSDNPADSIPALRMAQMLMRGKGGTFDFKGAGKYAEMARRHDIAAYIAAATGDHYKSRDIINNYQGSETSYLKLADAVSGLFYPLREHDFENIQNNWTVIDSLASTMNIATEEALSMAREITNYGITDKQGNYIVNPSLYDAMAYATDADSIFNSLSAQLFLADRFQSLGLLSDAKKYNDKANDNGRKGDGEITFSQERINELGTDPQAIAARAHNNAIKGYNDYRMTGYYYHIADSINNISHHYTLAPVFYADWFNFIAQAPDLSTPQQLMPLLRKDLSDSSRSAVAEYIMAIKHANGYGVPLDSAMSGSYLQAAASKGLADARVALGIALDMAGNNEGMKLLQKHVNNTSGMQTHPSAARYILSKRINDTGHIDYALVRKIESDPFAVLLKLGTLTEAQDLLHYDEETLRSLKGQINIVLSQNSDLTQFAYLFGKLAEINYALGNMDEAEFYIKVVGNLSSASTYTSFFTISELARHKGDIGNAPTFAAMFAKHFFLDNGKVLDESNRSQVIEHFYHLYPEILEAVKKEKKYDFAKNETFFYHDGFNRDRDFATFDSNVRSLHVDLPNYQKFTFPVTMPYFD